MWPLQKHALCNHLTIIFLWKTHLKCIGTVIITLVMQGNVPLLYNAVLVPNAPKQLITSLMPCPRHRYSDGRLTL